MRMIVAVRPLGALLKSAAHIFSVKVLKVLETIPNAYETQLRIKGRT